MARKKKVKENLDKADARHYRDTEKYVKMVDKLYQQAIAELSALAAKIDGIPEDKHFSFAHNKAIAKEVDGVIERLSSRIAATIERGSRKEWTAACVKSEEFIDAVLKVSKLTKKTLQGYQDRNLEALAAFTQREVNGLNLSKRVWKHVAPLKDEVEMVVDTTEKYYKHGINSGKTMTKMERAIGTGMSAQKLSREIRSCLIEPNKLFRRVRDKNGNLHLSKAAKLYHPGQGVYRSSYKNAMRLTRSEINMAYRQSDHLRWQQLDFVVGMKIELSNNHTCLGADGKPHPFNDICDELAGDYPKDFKFVGWHPQCRCHATPILKPLDEIGEGVVTKDGAYQELPASNEVKDVPKAFNDYLVANKERIQGWKSTPYYIKDNPQYYDKALHPEKYKAKPLVLNEDTHTKFSKMEMWGYNHQGNELFNKTLSDAKCAIENGNKSKFDELMARLQGMQEEDNSVLTRARARQSRRTQEEKDAIQTAWNERRAKVYKYQRYFDKAEEYIEKYGVERTLLDEFLKSNNGGKQIDYMLKIFSLSDRYEELKNAAIDRANKRIKELLKISEDFENVGGAKANSYAKKIRNYVGKVNKMKNKVAFANGDSFERSLSNMKKRIEEVKEHREEVRKAAEEWVKKRLPEKLNKVIDNCKNNKIDYLEVKQYDKEMTDDEIIARVGGGDITQGSCSSLAFCFAGNKAGLDVLDFRNGNSRKFFATNTNIYDITNAVGGIIEENFSDIAGSKNLWAKMEVGKYYYFCTGRHAAVIRKRNITENGKQKEQLEYLELQSYYSNGFKKLDTKVLRRRFSAKSTYSYYGIKFEEKSVLIDFELLQKDKGFRTMLGYINTEAGKQAKGKSGHER